MKKMRVKPFLIKLSDFNTFDFFFKYWRINALHGTIAVCMDGCIYEQNKENTVKLLQYQIFNLINFKH